MSFIFVGHRILNYIHIVFINNCTLHMYVRIVVYFPYINNDNKIALIHKYILITNYNRSLHICVYMYKLFDLTLI